MDEDLTMKITASQFGMRCYIDDNDRKIGACVIDTDNVYSSSHTNPSWIYGWEGVSNQDFAEAMDSLSISPRELLDNQLLFDELKWIFCDSRQMGTMPKEQYYRIREKFFDLDQCIVDRSIAIIERMIICHARRLRRETHAKLEQRLRKRVHRSSVDWIYVDEIPVDDRKDFLYRLDSVLRKLNDQPATP